MRIAIATPAPPHSRGGNRVTAERWRGIFRSLGHRAEIVAPDAAPAADLLVAIHARKSLPALRAALGLAPPPRLVVVLAGTDLTEDLAGAGEGGERVREALSIVDRIVVLHPFAAEEVPAPERARVRVILQSARGLAHPPPRTRRIIEFVVLGHLRAIKDPLLVPAAARLLPSRSRIRIAHLGAILEPELLGGVRRAMAEDARYRWLGERSHGDARRWLARAHALVHPSRAEGGANAVSEALALGTTVLASAIPGNLGLLGDDYPGVFPVGDAAGLAELFGRFEREPEFRAVLSARCASLAERHRPERELESWRRLIAELEHSIRT